MHDVIIIGAGPAGCFPAYRLARREVNGRKVRILILEASESLERLKPCGGEVDASVVEGIPELRDIVNGDVDVYTGYYDGAKISEEPRPEPGVTVTRTAVAGSLDAHLPAVLDRMENVSVRTGLRAVDIKVGDKGAKVRCKNGEVFAGRLVIDASGAGSRFYKRFMGVDLRKELMYVSSVIEFPVKGADKRRLMGHLEGNPRISRIDGFIEDPVGAYWIIYYDREDIVNIGCGFVEGRESREKLVRYLRFLGLRGWKPEGIHTWIIPVHTPGQLCADRILWIGDSAGMARAESGHGIGDFHRASGPLAETCLRALGSGDLSRAALESYQNSPEVQDILDRSRRYSRNVRVMLRVQNYVPRFIKRWFVTRVLPWMAARHRRKD